MLSGRIDVSRRDGLGHVTMIAQEEPGQFSGEVSQIGGRASLAQGRAGPEGCTALPFDAAHLRALLIGSAEIGEIIMRALILRRVGLIESKDAGTILIGRSNMPDLVRLQGFLSRNGHPYSVMDALHDEEARELVARLGVHAEELPLMLCPNGTVLRRPSDMQAAACLGMLPELDPSKLYDVVVVGAGPAGLATAVYAASEGLATLILTAAPWAARPARPPASRTIWVSQPAFQAKPWPGAPTTRLKSSELSWPFPSKPAPWSAEILTDRSGWRCRTASWSERARSCWRQEPAIADRTSRPGDVRGRRRLLLGFAGGSEALRRRGGRLWWEEGTQPDRRSCSSRRR